MTRGRTSQEVHDASASGKFNVSIHGLRGMSALLVFFFHIYDMSRLSGFFPHSPSIVVAILSNGAYGVELFFMISGYLITASLKKNSSIKNFFNERLIRIYPVFISLHVCIFLIGPVLKYKAFDGVSVEQWLVMFVENALFLPGIFAFTIVQKNAWSLSYEMLFYMVSAFVVWGARKFSFRVAIVLATIVTLPLIIIHPNGLFFVAGVAVNFAKNSVLVKKISSFMAAGGLLLMFACLYLHHDKFEYQLLASLGGTVFFLHIATQKMSCLKRLLELAPLQYVGTISYSFYLWHPIAAFFARALVLKMHVFLNNIEMVFVFGTVTLLLALVASYFSYKIIEVKAANILRGRFRSVNKNAFPA